MKIFVKSKPENWYKEECGKKNNTVRKLDGRDKIIIVNTETDEQIERIITDVTTYEDMIIISFKNLIA